MRVRTRRSSVSNLTEIEDEDAKEDTADIWGENHPAVEVYFEGGRLELLGFHHL